ncbi:MAG: hypothetical protein IJH12_07250 [Clostridia bacterium]|nr:hypothetical protein [Clostridia bacterium]
MDIMISSCKKDTEIYKSYALSDSNINVVGIAHTNDETIQQFLENNPDLLILDTTVDSINVLYVLSKLSIYSNNIGHKVILITEERHALLFDSTQLLGVLEKPITQEKILGALYKIKPVQQKILTPQDVKKLLLNLKIDLYSNGVHYLIEAIIMAAENHRLLQNLQEIYEKIGLKHNLPYEKIKWSIRSTIDTINKYTDAGLLSSVFKYYDEARALTPKYFIKLALYSFDIDADE